MFESISLKIERAKHHINDLNRQVEAYSVQRPMRFMRSRDQDRPRLTYTIKTHIPMPEDIPLVMGDAVHNLRTALDLLMFAMVNEKCPVSRTRFPWTQNWLNRSVQGGPEHDRQF